METWTDDERWDKIKKRFYQKGTCGECKGQKKGKKRRLGSMIMSIRKDLEIQKKGERREEGYNGGMD